MNIQIILLFKLISNLTLSRGKLVKSQYEALKSLYDFTDGENWYIILIFEPSLYSIITIDSLNINHKVISTSWSKMEL